jgi:hypothetical protein
MNCIIGPGGDLQIARIIGGRGGAKEFTPAKCRFGQDILNQVATPCGHWCSMFNDIYVTSSTQGGALRYVLLECASPPVRRYLQDDLRAAVAAKLPPVVEPGAEEGDEEE